MGHAQLKERDTGANSNWLTKLRYYANAITVNIDKDELGGDRDKAHTYTVDSGF